MVNLREKSLAVIREKLDNYQPESLEDINRCGVEAQVRAVMALRESQQIYEGDLDRISYGPRRYTG